MKKQILILTQPRDVHAYAVAEALSRKGHQPIVWQTADFPSRACESVLVADEKCSLRIRDSEGDMLPTAVDTIWNRRPDYVLDEENLDPADCDYAELNCRLFRKSLFDILATNCFWVNPHVSVRNLTKLSQMVEAQKLGLKIPRTLFSNDSIEIQRFSRLCRNGLVFKPMTSLPWRSDTSYWVPYTSEFIPDQIEAESLQLAPGIFQEKIPKKYEVRATVMGSEVFAAKLLSQQTEKGKLDWRQAYDELQMEPWKMPESLRRTCTELLTRLGLVFGCFDFIVTREGEPIFLEVNQMGQFLFIERATGLPLVDALAEYLISGTPDFRYEPGTKPILYTDVKEVSRNAVKKATEEHVVPPPLFWEELQT